MSFLKNFAKSVAKGVFYASCLSPCYLHGYHVNAKRNELIDEYETLVKEHPGDVIYLESTLEKTCLKLKDFVVSLKNTGAYNDSSIYMQNKDALKKSFEDTFSSFSINENNLRSRKWIKNFSDSDVLTRLSLSGYHTNVSWRDREFSKMLVSFSDIKDDISRIYNSFDQATSGIDLVNKTLDDYWTKARGRVSGPDYHVITFTLPRPDFDD